MQSRQAFTTWRCGEEIRVRRQKHSPPAAKRHLPSVAAGPRSDISSGSNRQRFFPSAIQTQAGNPDLRPGEAPRLLPGSLFITNETWSGADCRAGEPANKLTSARVSATWPHPVAGHIAGGNPGRDLCCRTTRCSGFSATSGDSIRCRVVSTLGRVPLR